jgi:aminoglycoside phosphotransferase
MKDEYPILPMEELIAAYEADFIDEPRHVLSFSLVACMPKMKKWILEYAVTYEKQHGEEFQETVIGKIFSDPEKGMAGYRLMRHLWANGMNDEVDYTIVRPIAYLQSYNFLLMSKAPGKIIRDWMYETDQAVDAAYHVAIWLKRLHQVPLMQIKQLRRTRADIDFTRLITELTKVVPEKEVAFQTLVNRLTLHPVTAGKENLAMLHGDFHIKNVFWDGHKVTAIDFDHHFIGDTAWDVAYHACQIQLSAFYKKGDFRYFQPAVKTLIDTYLTEIPESEHQSFLMRLFQCRSRSLFESLHYELCVCKTGALDIVDPFLQECELSLQGSAFE